MVTIDLRLVGDLILILVGIIAIIFLISFLKNAGAALNSLQELIDKNSKNIDETMEKIPGLVSKAENLVDNLNDVVNDPNLKMAIEKANDTITNVSLITDDVKDTVNYFGSYAVDSVDTFGEGISSITDYASLIKDVIDIVRSVISGR